MEDDEKLPTVKVLVKVSQSRLAVEVTVEESFQ
jgi:hypothetical protein